MKKTTPSTGRAKASRGARPTQRPATTEAAEAATVSNSVALVSRPVGRPSSYRPEYAAEAKKLCAIFGAIDVQLAAHFGVTEKTITTWKKEHPEFLLSLNAGKDETNEKVERSLVKRALGWSHKATKLFVVDGEIQEKEYIERYPGDTTAMIFFLKNRMPERYRDKATIEHEFGATIEAMVTESWKH